MTPPSEQKRAQPLLESTDRRRDRLFAVVAWALAALVLVQAALAGQFVNSNPGLVSLHRVLAEALPVVAVGLAVLAWINRQSLGVRLVACSAAIVILTVAQTGLGFAGRSSPSSAAIHIPLGVLLFGLAIYVAAMSSSMTKAER